jgi:hypothetical protein
MIGLAGLFMFLLSIVEGLLAFRGSPLDFLASGIFMAGALLSLLPVQRLIQNQLGWDTSPENIMRILLVLFLGGGLIMFANLMNLEPGKAKAPSQEQAGKAQAVIQSKD